MVLDGIYEGVYVDLRSVDISDAEYTLDIRQDIKRTRFLHSVDNNLEKQRQWIQTQRDREGDYFFIVQTKKGKPVGTVSIYDIEGKRGQDGRLLMMGNPILSYEGHYLVLKIAFEILGLDEVWNYVNSENTASLRFGKSFCFQYAEPVINSEGISACYGVLNKDVFYEHEAEITSMFYRKSC